MSTKVVGLRVPDYALAHHVKGTPDRYKHGWIPLIHAEDLSTPDARRSREVSLTEFRRIAAKGAIQHAKLVTDSSPTTGLDANWDSIKDDAYGEISKSWGGATYDSHTGKKLEGDADLYAVTARPPGMNTVRIPENPSKSAFGKAMDVARIRYHDILQRAQHNLGVFHDDDLKSVDIDPVLTVDSPAKVESIGAFTHAVGGAYHFKSGDGFWPPHVAGKPKTTKKVA